MATFGAREGQLALWSRWSLQGFVAKAYCRIGLLLAFEVLLGDYREVVGVRSSLHFAVTQSKRVLRGLSSLGKLVFGNCIHSNVREGPTKVAG